MKDPRHSSYITYDTATMLFMMILKNACRLKSMRSMTNGLNKEECIANMRKYLDIKELEELPHYDTINDFLSRLNPEELNDIRTYMMQELLQKHCLETYRINGKYWGIIIDGTGLFTFREKHCEHCLKREYTNEETGEKKTIYMHHVLEAKLVAGNMVFSIDSEFIENESEHVEKQDCKRNAFYRLANRLKKNFKRLPICLIADSLYACENVFKDCDEKNWKYIFRFKEGSIPTVMREFQALKKESIEKKSKSMHWVNQIAYKDREVNMLEEQEKKEREWRTYTFLTNLKVTKKNAAYLSDAGQSRWRIENEGFNNQKNHRYDIEHVHSQNYTAMKNHYLLIQITDIFVQLFEHGGKRIKKLKKTAKEISSNLLESIRTRFLTDEDIKKTR